MALTEPTRNRRFTELYRNATVFPTKQQAITSMYDADLINSLKDGEPLLGRYIAYFKFDKTTGRYIHEDSPSVSASNYVFTRLVSTETTGRTTKEYINGDIINCEDTQKAYICTARPADVVPVDTDYTDGAYFDRLDGSTLQYVETIRVIMAVATIFDDGHGSVELQKNPPKGKLTFFEEDDVIREMLNQVNISSPNKTIEITDTTSGKNIDVNFDNLTIKQHPNNYATTALQNKLYVNHGNTISEDQTTGVLDVRTGNSLKVSAGGSGNPTAGTIDVKSGNTIKVSAGGSGEPDAGTLDVKTGTSLTVSAGGTGNPEAGTINVNFDNQTIKQYASDYETAELQNKLYVNVNSSYGLENDGANGIKVRLGKGLDFRSGDSTAANNGKIDVQYDDNTIGLNDSNQLVTNFHSGTGSGSTTMERKSHTNADTGVIDYDGWGVKHGTTISEDTDGIHVNIDDVSIKQYASDYTTTALRNKLYVKHDTTIVTDSTNGLGVNIDNKSIKQVASGDDANKLYVNIDKLTIKQYASDYSTTALRDKLYVNIDGTTLISDPTTGVISVNPDNISIYGENAIDIDDHYVDPTVQDPVVDGKIIKLVIDSNDKILSQSANGLLTTLAIEKFTTTDYDGTTTLPTNVKERYRLRGKNTGTVQEPSYEYFDVPIDIYKDSSLVDVHLGHIGDTIKPESEWVSGHTSPVYPDDYTVVTSGDDALCFVYQLADETYEMVSVNVESYLNEAEFKDGLSVNASTHEVSAKLWNGLAFYDHGGTPVQNKSIVARIGNGLQFGSGTDGQKPVELRIGDGLQFSGSTDGEKSVAVKTGDGIGINGEGGMYVNYATVGSAIRPVYWDGTNHTPVQIDYTIETSVPANAVFTDTTYSSGNEITIDSTNNHINHDAKLGTAFTSTTATTSISGWGGTGSFKVPVLTINEYGHVTSASEATMTITMPENKIVTYTAPTYDTAHVTTAYQTIIANNVIAVDDVYDTAINKLDNKLAGLVKECNDREAVISQAMEDEPRYFAKSSTTTAASGTVALTATIVDSRNYYLFNGTKVDVYFANEQTVTTGTLNINGANNPSGSGAHYLVYNDELFDVSLIKAGTTLAVVYDDATVTIGGTNYSGVYRVVGGVGSGSGSTNGITDINAGNGITVTKDYTEVTINTDGTTYGSNWLKNAAGTEVITPATNTVYRVITAGNYYNMAYTWNGTKYVLSTDIEETIAVKLGNGLVFGNGTDGQKPIEINLADNMIPEGSTSGSATEISGLATLLKFTSNGELAMENTWDCGTY